MLLARVVRIAKGERFSPTASEGSTELEIESKEDLIRYFADGAKPRQSWRVGTEYESIAVSSRNGAALPYSGAHGVERMLRTLAERFSYEVAEEEGRALALVGPRSSITLEPGAQIELSGEQCDTIHCAYREFSQHVQRLLDVSREFDAVLVGLGMQPVSRLEEIELIPKARYRIMFPYMARKGRLGQRMMKQTAGVQANLDYSDEADAMRKLRLSAGLVPLLYAMFANSPLSDGGLNGYQSFRGHIWLDTDPDRCGLPEFLFRDDAGFEDYAEYALDVPMYFLERDHRYIDLTQPPGLTFRRFLRDGWQGERATLEDWALHLTTIFTEVRLKRYIEVRCADSQPPGLILSLPALLKGVLCDSDAMQGAWDLVKRWSFEERLRLTDMAHKLGLEARVGKIRLQELALELLEIAIAGLTRAHELNERGEDESVYLYRMFDLVRSGRNQATLAIERWKGRWNYQVERMLKECSYEADNLSVNAS
jgi:glutamate--cysteine ligase